ncbi:MAG: hypothetical protein WD066_03095 [Planctomycetaceae bacterium]
MALLSALAFAGCGGSDGPKLGNVSGTITLDGKPVGAGYVVEFIPHTEAEGEVRQDSSKPTSSGMTDDSGKYVLRYGNTEREGAELGKHGVVIVNAQEMKLPGAYSSGDVATARAFWATVDSGPQVIDIPLDSSPTPAQVDLEKK